MNKLSALIFVALMLSVPAFAQNGYMLEVKNDSKTINADELGLPETATLMEVLSLLPELLSRPKMDFLSNYDIQVGGFSLGADKEAAMTMVHVADIDNISISESSVNSYTGKGSGGSIDITLKAMEKGLSGNVDVTAYSIPQINPTVFLGYRSDKVKIRGLLGYNRSRLGNYAVSREYTLYSGSDTTTINSEFGMAHIYAQYSPTNSDVLSLQLSQSYRENSKDLTGILCDTDDLSRIDKQYADSEVNISVEASYQHTFSDKSVLKFKANYSGQPDNESGESSFSRDVSTDKHSGTVSGKIDYTCHFPRTDGGEAPSLNFGVNGNRSFSSSNHEEQLNIFGLTRFSHNVYTDGDNIFLSPYAQFEALLGKVRLKAMADYQYYSYSVKSRDDAKFNNDRIDFTCKLMAGWQMGEHNHLRLILDRKIRRPSGIQVYPFVLYEPANSDFYKGNPKLVPEQIHEASLDYITDVRTSSGAYLMANTSLAYIYVGDRIRPLKGDRTTEKNFPYDFMTYTNAGANNIINANLMLYYSKGIFNLSLTGNVYANYDVNGPVTDHYNYYSLSVYPSFHFKDDWRASMKAIYHSPVSTNYVSYGHSASVNLYVGKTWGNFTVGIDGKLQLIKRTTDITHGANEAVTKETYIPDYSYVALNLNYRF